MPKCKVCLKVFAKLRFDTGRTAVCGRCVSMLNTRPAVAEGAQQPGALVQPLGQRDVHQRVVQETAVASEQPITGLPSSPSLGRHGRQCTHP